MDESYFRSRINNFYRRDIPVVKKLIIILLFLIGCVKYEVGAQTIWYVTTGGSDVSGAGTSASPWATIYKAATDPSVSTGDIISVGAGTFYITNQVPLDGVKLHGQGYTTRVIASTASYSVNVTNTSGSVIDITGIRFDGNNAAFGGVQVYNTDNVWIYNCFFENFVRSAANFEGTTNRTNNRFYSNVVYNCSGGIVSPYTDESYAVKIDHQAGFVFDYNTVTENIRAVSGVAVGGLAGTTGLLMRGNTITANFHTATAWPFAIELWYATSPTMTENTFIGEIDFGGYGCTGLVFSDNLVGPVSPIGRSATGLQIEQYCSNVSITKNIFRNLDQPIYFCNNWTVDKTDYIDNVDINTNLIYNVTGYSGGYGIRFETGDNDNGYYPPSYVNDIKIYNNTIVAHSTSIADYGILLPTQARTGNVTNIEVINNIVYGFSSYAIYGYRQDDDFSQSIAGLKIQNNNYYSNGNNSAYFSGFTPSTYTSSGNLTSNPVFVSTSDFHLQNTSSLIRGGLYVALTSDLDDVNYLNPPTMGAYESVSEGETAPAVITGLVANVTTTSATCGGDVTSEGSSTVTAKGVCYNTTGAPTISDSHTSNGTGLGSFTGSLAGLTNSTTYYVRAYATNNTGTSYGTVRTFTTGIPVAAPGVYFVEDNEFVIINGKIVILP